MGKISSFVNRAVEKELSELEKEQKQKREESRQQLIKGYQARAKNKNLSKMLRDYGEMSWENISAELAKKERENDKNKQPRSIKKIS